MTCFATHGCGKNVVSHLINKTKTKEQHPAIVGSVHVYKPIMWLQFRPTGALNLNRLKTDKLGTSELALLLQKPTLTQTKRKLPQAPRSAR